MLSGSEKLVHCAKQWPNAGTHLSDFVFPLKLLPLDAHLCRKLFIALAIRQLIDNVIKIVVPNLHALVFVGRRNLQRCDRESEVTQPCDLVFLLLFFSFIVQKPRVVSLRFEQP